MENEWAIIRNYEKFLILRKSESNEYGLFKKSLNKADSLEPIQYFTASAPEQADDIGCNLAKLHKLS